MSSKGWERQRRDGNGRGQGKDWTGVEGKGWAREKIESSRKEWKRC